MRGLPEAYRALSDIYKGAWIDEAIRGQGASLADNKGAFRLVYGVVEHEYLYEYRLSRLAERSPKAAVKTLLKMGMFLLDDSDLPDYAAVNEIAETAKKVGKGGLTGFLNAVLRRYAAEGKDLFPTDPDELLSVKANLPIPLVRRYVSELGREAAERRLTTPRTVKTHLRPSFSLGRDAFLSLLKERGVGYEETAHGAYVGAVSPLADLLRDGRATVMSFGSAEIASAVPYERGEILDLCAAPGGKSIYLAEKYGAPVIACDLHPHRVELIVKYAARMGASTVQPLLSDGTALHEEWRGRFAVVLLDAPCSGLGSLATNPDVALHRTAADLDEIVKTQSRLIERAGEYVAAGGCLVYATCSDLPSEDGDVVRAYLNDHPSFSLEKERYTDPEEGGGESYYYAILRKV